jgi:uncharacterized phage infection (PIP) family protein YhgE
LGKILTVLVVLVAFTFAVMLVSGVVLSDKWKDRYMEQVRLFEKAKEQRDMAFSQRDDLRANAEADKAVLHQQVNTLTDELALRKNTITTLQTEKENQEKRLQELAEKLAGLDASFSKLMTEKDAWRTERDNALKAKDDLMTMYAQLEEKFRASVSDLQNLREQLRQTAEKLSAAESRLSYVAQQPEVQMPAQVPAVPGHKVTGMVTRADEQARVAEINIGSDDGVVKGMKMYVFDQAQAKYLATLTITAVSTNSAAGELSMIKGPVKANTHVTNRFD